MRLTFTPVWDRELGRYAPWVRECKGLSGAYVLRSMATGALLYVGESHRGKLYETMTRHFQEWTGETAGQTYDKLRTEAAAIVCVAGEAVELQNQLIGELRPRDNVVGNDPADDDEEIPF